MVFETNASSKVTPRERPAGVIPSLTALRGLLAIWVVVYHYGNDLLRLFPGLSPAGPLFGAGGMAVPGFFMLSGFVLAHNYGTTLATPGARKSARFLGLRLVRIYPVHFVTLLTVLAMSVVGRRVGYYLTDAGYTARDFLLNMLLAHYWVPLVQAELELPLMVD